MQAIEVLLVDDSEDYVSAVTSWLAEWPELQLVGVAGTGERAGEMVVALKPDLVLMDVSMPGISGFEAVGRIKALSDPPKIIMLTLNADGPARRAALVAGADAFVAKAEVTTTLLPTVARLFPDTVAGTTHGCTEHLLQRFANDVSAATGTAFFELLVEYIAGCLGFDVVTVGELAGEGCENVRSIAAWPRGITPADFEQDMSGTPCERVAHGEFLTHANGVREEYPCAESIHALAIDSYIGAPLVGSDGRVIGLICGYGRGPVANQAVAEMMFRIVAGRAGAELERELSRREIERSEAMFRGLIEGTHDIVALIDTDDAFTYVSPAVERWLGYRPVDCAGIKVIDLVHELDRPQVEALLRRTDRPAPDCLVEARIRHADGTWRTMESSIAEHYDGAGHRFRVVTARDLTERRRLEDHLQQSQRTEIIGRLTAGVAHDFGNILMVIRTHADILALRTVEGDPKQKYVDAILDAVTRGSGLTRQLLAFHRQRVFEPQQVELNASIDQMTSLLRRLVGSQIQLVSDLSPDAGVIVADPTQIEQIILNLIINARDAMPDGGQITIETAAVPDDAVPNWAGRMPGEYVRLSVTDTGCGIRDDVKGQIFDPLFTTKQEGYGTGIGLATVQGIVGRHGGVIQVDTAEHRGSTFRIYLPRGPLTT